MEELAILCLDQLGSKFFNLAIFPFLVPSDPGDVETIAGVRAGDGPCDWFLLGHQDDLWGIMLRTRSAWGPIVARVGIVVRGFSQGRRILDRLLAICVIGRGN